MFNITKLMEPISAEKPCGDYESLENDFFLLEDLVTSKEVSQFEDPTGEAGDALKEPNWKKVQEVWEDLAGKVKHIRLAVIGLSLGTALEGYDGFLEGLKVMRGWIDGFWDGIYPLADPDDSDGPNSERLMKFNFLHTDPSIKQDRLMFLLKRIPLCRSPLLGSFTWEQIETRLDDPNVLGAFSNTPREMLQGVAQPIQACLDELEGIRKATEEKVMATQERGPEFAVLVQMLKRIQGFLKPFVQEEAVQEVSVGGEGEVVGSVASGGGTRPASISGQVTCREDVVKALDAICAYYRKAEPASPVPLLLSRAKHWVEMDFVQLIQDMLPDSVQSVKQLGGIRDEEKSGW